MDRQQVKELLERYDSGQCSYEEQVLINHWYGLESDKQVFDRDDPAYLQRKQRTFRNLVQEPKKWKLPYFAAAAAILILLGICVAVFKPASTGNDYDNDINPGTNRAVLTLENGHKLILEDLKDGVLGNQGGTSITKTGDGRLVYAVCPDCQQDLTLDANIEKVLNRIETPKGGQYQVYLPDGTKVWLNAASKLIYPASFNGREERRVEVSGEAYFEVTKNKSQPFIVTAKNQEIVVLGTHFNISSYPEETAIRTTLLEGSVKIKQLGDFIKETILKPGEQSVLNSTSIDIASVDTDNVVAWKNGEFAFRNEPLKSIMQKIARWYDADVVYENEEVSNRRFGGTVSRYGKVSEVLSVFERTGNVKFKIQGRKIMISG